VSGLFERKGISMKNMNTDPRIMQIRADRWRLKTLEPLPVCPNCGERYLGTGVELCIDCGGKEIERTLLKGEE